MKHYCEEFNNKQAIKALFLFLLDSVQLFWGSAPWVAFNRLTLHSPKIEAFLLSNGSLGSNFLIGCISFLACVALFGTILKKSLTEAVKSSISAKGILFGVGIMAMINVGMRLASALVRTRMEQLGGNQHIAEEASHGNAVLFIILVAVLGPVVEETIYRYGLYRMLAGRSKTMACIVSALVFGLAHIWLGFIHGADVTHLLTILPYFVFGVGTAVIYEKSGNLWCCIVTHSLMNLGAYFGV